MKNLLMLFFCILLLNSCATKYFTYIPKVGNPICNCDPLRKHVKKFLPPHDLDSFNHEIDCDSLLKKLREFDPNISFYKLTDSLEKVVFRFPFRVACEDSNLFVYSVEKRSYCDGILKEGDRILRVNGKNYTKHNVDSMFAQFIVPVGSKINLDILGNDNEVVNIKLHVTEFIETPWENETFDDTILYIRPYSFSLGLISLMSIRFVNFAQKHLKMILVLDLRSNRQINNRDVLLFLDLLFSEKEKYLSIKDYGSGKIEDRKGIRSGPGFPEVYVLINESTAKGASLIAQVIKHNKRGVIIGTTAVGSDAISNIFPINDKYLISLKIADIYGPDGTKITGAPIEPDFVIKSRQYMQFTDIASIHMDFGLKEVLKIIQKK
jgi:C-terminal processing protease CtpA/Prc